MDCRLAKGSHVDFGVNWNDRPSGLDLDAETTGNVPGIDEGQCCLAHQDHVCRGGVIGCAVEERSSGRDNIRLASRKQDAVAESADVVSRQESSGDESLRYGDFLSNAGKI